MSEVDELSIALRRETYDLKENILAFAIKLRDFDADAVSAVERAHMALFEAWTILCMPPDDDEDEEH